MGNLCCCKAPPSAPARLKPYQGVRVRDPVKELLRRKRSLEPHGTQTTPPAADVVETNNVTSHTKGKSVSDVDYLAQPLVAVSDGGLQSAGWRVAPTATVADLPPVVPPWSTSDYNQQDFSSQTLAYSHAPNLTADVYMQTLCPSYTMLTYTHPPLLTNFGTIPMATAAASLPQMELPDPGLTYLPWAQSLTTISTIPNTGVQFPPSSAALPGSPMVRMPLSMSLTTVVPQLESQCVDHRPPIQDLQQRSDHQMDPGQRVLSLDEDTRELESQSLLDKLLETQDDDVVEEDKDSYSCSVFTLNT